MATKVELGTCKLLRSNANYLHQSLFIHTRNVKNIQFCELAWSDGERVWLSPVDFECSRKEVTGVSANEACLVGEFGGFVCGVSCSEVTKGSIGYYIAVILKDKVVVLFRKIGEAVATCRLVKEHFMECIPQGYEWHPSLPLLALLSKSAAVILHLSEEFEGTVIPVQTSHRNLQTCAWSNNGNCLAVAVEDSLCIFSWMDLTEPHHFTFDQWSSLELNGKIKCIVPWKTCSFVIATECPLDKLCVNNESNADLFEVENIFQNHQDSKDIHHEGTFKTSGFTCHATNDVATGILSKRTDKDITSLLKFKLRKQHFDLSPTLAQVIAICCEDAKPTDICSTSIEGLVSPDLLLFQPETNAVVVGSHCSSKLHCYRLLTCNLNGKTEFKAKGRVLQVNPDAKPKGICLIPGNTDSFLILLGGSKELSNIVAFPPSTATEQYDVSVQCCNAFICKDIAMRSLQKFDQPESSDHGFSQETALNEEDTSVVFTDGDCTPTLRLPDGSVFKSSGKTVEMEEKPTLISELEVTHGLKVNGNSKESVQEDLSNCLKEVKEVKTAVTASVSQMTEQLCKLEKRVSEIDSSYNLYPLPDNAEFVSVVWTDELTGAVEQENFLLDKGRLKLKAVKQAFNASLVRMTIGDVPCIVSPGEGGFIPVRFISASTVQMSGHSRHQQNTE